MNKKIAIELLQKVHNSPHSFTDYEPDDDGVNIILNIYVFKIIFLLKYIFIPLDICIRQYPMCLIELRPG